MAEADGDDVYYRFGGCVNIRYAPSEIQKNEEIKDEKKVGNIKKEITILHGMNSKQKITMPDYLQYRDSGYIYSQHPKFIPFLRQVDTTVKQLILMFLKNMEENSLR